MPDEPQADDTAMPSGDVVEAHHDVPQEDLKKKIEEAQAADAAISESVPDTNQDSEAQQLKDQLARCLADMQNMKRRAEEDKFQFIKFANAEMLKALLPIIDNFDRACQQIPENLTEDNWCKGVVSTHDELMKVLEKLGIKRIKTVGEKLNPSLHEALMQTPGEKDIIMNEMEPGYTYHEQTLKPAKVSVGNGEK